MPPGDNNNDGDNNGEKTAERNPTQQSNSLCNCEPYEHTNWPFFTVACNPTNQQDCCKVCNTMPGEFTYLCKETTGISRMMYQVPEHYCSSSLGKKIMA